ncbi:hypothetical protein J2R80_003993 [Bradyrhizobium sp. USDA 4541]|nr:hypothetical protein [Bradyrhizobium sp. USDA 4541]
MPELREVRLSRQDRKVLEACCRSPMTFSDLKRARIVLLAKAGSRPQTGVHMRTGRSSASTPDLETSHASSLCLVFEPGSGSDRCLARLLLDHLFVQAPQLATVSDLAKRFVSLLSGSDIAELDEKQALGSVFKALTRHQLPNGPQRFACAWRSTLPPHSVAIRNHNSFMHLLRTRPMLQRRQMTEG